MIFNTLPLYLRREDWQYCVSPMTLSWIKSFLERCHRQYEISVDDKLNKYGQRKILLRTLFLDSHYWVQFYNKVCRLDYCEFCGSCERTENVSFCWIIKKKVFSESYKRCRYRKRIFNDFTLKL